MTHPAVVVGLVKVGLLLLQSAPSSARTLTFEKDRCGGPYIPTPSESLEVTHTGAPLSSMCRDMSFSHAGFDYSTSVEREVCVKVTSYKMACSQTLEYRAGTMRGNPAKSYDCNDEASTIPVFCTFEVLYVRIKAEDPSDKTKVYYTVYSGKEKPEDEEPFPIFSVLGPLFLVAIFVGMCIFAYYLRRKRANQDGTALYRRDQQPQVTVHHYYHPVQHQDALGNQVQGQAYPQQGYTGPPPFQNYPAPNAPGVYPYAAGQQMAPPKASPAMTTSSSEPPSYDEVTKQKL